MIAIAIETEIETVAEIATETESDVEVGRPLIGQEETTTIPTRPAEIIVHARERNVTTEGGRTETGTEIVVHGEETTTDATTVENETYSTTAEALVVKGRMIGAQEKIETSSQLKHEAPRQTALLPRNASPLPT